MKFYTFRFGSILLVIIGYATGASTQCSATYSTANNFCDLDSLYLTVHPAGGTGPYTFLWETDEITQTISIPLANGDYLVTVTDANGCVAIINCHIKPGPLVLYYPYNQNACEGDTVTVFLQWYRDSIPGATYLWSTGETTPTIQITDDITWSVTVTDPSTGCAFVIPPNLFDFHPTPYPQIVGPTMLCTGQTAVLSVTGGPFGTIIWYIEPFLWDPIYSDTLVIDQPGTYHVWGSSTEVGYCWHQDTIVVGPGDIEPPVLNGPPDLCSGQSGAITITNSNAFTLFNWSNGQSTSSITVNQPGTYSVTVSNSGGCSATGNITIADGSGFNISVTPAGSTCGEDNGSINLIVSPPGTYTYNWSNGSTTEDIANVPAGSYSVTVTSSNGCSTVSTTIIPDNPLPINLSGAVTPNTSCNFFNGAIDLSISPSGIYNYQWSNGASTEDLTQLNPGSYSVIVTLGDNCTATETFLVTNNANAPVPAATETATTCGMVNGAIDLTISGGQGPFSYIWSDGAQTEDLANITAGSYSVTVTGSNGCTGTIVVVVPDEQITLTLTADVNPVTSCTETNGSIDLTVTPDGSYTFLWSNGATTEDISSLAEGIYSVEVLFGVTCMQTAVFAIEHEGNQMVLNAETTPNTSCSSANGAIDITVSPADAYTFLWSNGATTEDLEDLPAGTYLVTITGSDNCSISGTFIIGNAQVIPSIQGLITEATCGAPTGAIDLTVTPASGNEFLWSNGLASEDITDLAGGIYIVTVTNQNGCAIVDSFVVPNVSSTFTLNGTLVDNSSCAGGNGSIDILVSPAGSYSFIWSTGATTEDLQNLAPGGYTLTVTDALNCVSTWSFAIGNSVTIPVVSSSATSATCGQENGEIDLSVTPQDSYLFAWSNGMTSEDLSGVVPGTYTVTVTGSNGCLTIDTISVPNSVNTFTLSYESTDNSSCTSPNASIDVTIAPAGSYSFIWSNGMTSEDLQNLAGGIYIVTVMDSQNCMTSDTVIIENTITVPLLTSEITPATCGLANGSIDLSVTPAGANSYSWSAGSTEEDLQNLPAGIYSVTVTSSNGCTAEATFQVANESTDIEVTAIISPNTSCESANGSIDLQVLPQGNYNFLWSTGAITEDLQQLIPGLYLVTVTDSLSCNAVDTFQVVSDQTTPLITEIIVPSTCGQDNGSIDITVNPSAGTTYVWSNDQVTEDLQNLLPGNYAVTITTSLGCISDASFVVPETGIQFSLSNTSVSNTSCISPNGEIDLSVTPFGNYHFAWSNGSSTEDIRDLSSGIYEVTVTDSMGCATNMIVAIADEITLPDVTSLVTPETCGQSNGAVRLSVFPATGNTFLWSTGDTSAELAGLAPGSYGVTVTDAQGCVWTSNFLVPGMVMPVIDLGADLIVEPGQEITLHAIINVPTSALDTVIWLPGELFSCALPICLDQTFIPLERTEVVLMVFDTNGCMAEESVMVDVRSVNDPSVFIPNVFSPNTDGVNDVFTVFANPDVDEVADLRIFDRWGEFVFQNQNFPPNNFDYGWDGSYKSKLMDPQVFVYWTIVKFKSGEERMYKGDVTLIR